MSAQTADSSTTDDDFPDEEYVEEEQTRKIVIGVAVLVIGAALTLGILYYFGVMAAVGW